MTRAVVYQHEPHEPLGWLEPALVKAGFTIDLRLRAPRPEDADAPLLVVMGGAMGVYEASQHPFLWTELDVLRRRLAARRPILGICLGSQLLAAATGARVAPGANGVEIGIEPVSLTDAGRADPVFGALPSPCDMPQWHGDTWDEVPGATVLASSRQYANQAFRLGDTYGIQFHPEVSPEILADWIAFAPQDIARAGKDAKRIGEDLRRLHDASVTIQAFLERLARHFADVCRQGA